MLAHAPRQFPSWLIFDVGQKMIAVDVNVEQRMPVWSALSELFLDTTLDEKDVARIAAVLAASLYSEEELDEILRFEVSPVCKWNFFVVAGEWAGWDDEWIREKIAPRIGKRPLLRFRVFGPIRPLWTRVRGQVAALRAK